jgi:nucleoid-associated protein EbfC
VDRRSRLRRRRSTRADPELLADTILAAVNEALRSVNALAQSRLGGMAGGLGLPGL